MNATISAPAFSTILSVNPVAKTLGAMHPELQASIIRSGRVIAHKTRRTAAVLSTVFAVNASRPYSALLLVARILFGLMFIVMGACALGLLPFETTLTLPQWGAITEIAAGSALVLGFFSRLSMLALAAVYGWTIYSAAIVGLFPQTAILCLLGALLNSIAGPGRFSLDRLLYRALSKN